MTSEELERTAKLAFEAMVGHIPIQTRHPSGHTWENAGDKLRAAWRDVARAVAAAERDRIRRLAEAVDAYYTVTTQIVGGGWDVQERKFAEVITDAEKR